MEILYMSTGDTGRFQVNDTHIHIHTYSQVIEERCQDHVVLLLHKSDHVLQDTVESFMMMMSV